jgi:hypothetical protein
MEMTSLRVSLFLFLSKVVELILFSGFFEVHIFEVI